MLTLFLRMYIVKDSQTFIPIPKNPEHFSKESDSSSNYYASKFWHVGNPKPGGLFAEKWEATFFNYLPVIKGLDSEARVPGVQWGLWV